KEVRPVKAGGAAMDSLEVLPMSKGGRIADFNISGTGGKDVLTATHFPRLKDRVVLGNCRHFDNEISKGGLDRLSKTKKKVREFVDEYVFPDGKRIHLIAEGRLLNIAAGQGHPV